MVDRAVPAWQVALGPGRLLPRPGAEPLPQEPEGWNSGALTLEGLQGPRRGSLEAGSGQPRTEYASGKARSWAGLEPWHTPRASLPGTRAAWGPRAGPLALAWGGGVNRARPEGLSPPLGPVQLPILPCSGPKKLKTVSSYIKKRNRFPAKGLVGEEGKWDREGMGRGGLQNSCFF